MYFMNLIIGALMIGSVYGVVGMGYSLVYKATGLINMAQGDFLMFGAFLGLTFYKYLEFPYYIAIILTFVVMFGLGAFIQSCIIKPLLNKGAQYIFIIICTAAIAMVLQNGAMVIWGSNIKQFPSIFSTSSISIFGTNIAPESLLVLGISIVCTFGLFYYMNKTRFGTAMRAAALDDKAASTMGINVSLTKGVTWGLSAGLAGIIGATLGPVFGVYTTMGALIGNKAFAGAVVGGYGNIYGAIIGGMFFGFLETFTSAFITTTFKDAISFGMLIIVMIFMPNGIFKAKVLD